ncbi:mechanosensitive ion channel family protein [Ilumatobacter sp.]|uniref:mechanosensitive ion channel family protein n=1 Tax=Ilumatobacter sp. TaxID=1967498 RepID=UPI003AF809D4
MEIVRSSEPCYERDGSLCSWVYEQSDGNAALANGVNWFVDKPLQIVFILVVAWILSRLARRWVARFVTHAVAPSRSSFDRLARMGLELPDTLAPDENDPRRRGRADSISTVLTSFTITVIWVIAGLLILGAVGVQIGPLIAGAGIAGVALGFGAQSLVKDCIAGLFMLIEDQYGIGDFADLGEATGIVEGFSLRTTVLRSIDGTVWHVPNGVVQRVGNRSQHWSVAVVDVDVAYDTDLQRARELFERAAVEVCELPEFSEVVLEPPQVLGIEALAADGISIRLTVKVAPGEQWGLQRALREHVKYVFDEASIEIPFPQRTVWMRVDNDSPPVARPEPQPG